MEEKMIQKLNAAISAVFIVAALILFGVAFRNRRAQQPAPASAETSTTAPSQDASSYQDLAGMQHLELAKDFASWTPRAVVDPEKTRSAMLAVTGKISKAYLEVRASVEGKPLTKYESLFVKLNDTGGHLFRPRSLETPGTDTATSLLFDAGDVPVLPNIPYDERRTPEAANLLTLLQDGKTVRLTAFISSLRPALLEALSISYVCAADSECAIALR